VGTRRAARDAHRARARGAPARGRGPLLEGDRRAPRTLGQDGRDASREPHGQAQRAQDVGPGAPRDPRGPGRALSLWIGRNTDPDPWFPGIGSRGYKSEKSALSLILGLGVAADQAGARAGRPAAGSEAKSVIVKLLLADGHRLVREGVRRLLEEKPDLRVVAEASTGEEALELAAQHDPDVAVLELTMPRLSGVEAIRRIRQRGLRTRCLVLSMHDGQIQVTQALQAGAAGYLLKSCSAGELREAIAAVAAGRSYLSPAIADRVVEALVQPGETASRVSLLTGREREVLQLIAEGLSSKEIAAALGVSIKTVETHRCKLMAKLKIRKASRLVRVAIHEGLVALLLRDGGIDPRRAF